MDLAEIIRVLVRHDVAFIVVGGLAGVLQGVPLHTLDLDVVYARDDDNIDKLLAALRELDAVFRNDPRRIAPNESHLRAPGRKQLGTNQGALDVLGTIEDSTSYAELLPDTRELDAAGVRFRVVTLERLIALKKQLDRPKDRAALLLLEATLEERERGS